MTVARRIGHRPDHFHFTPREVQRIDRHRRHREDSEQQQPAPRADRQLRGHQRIALTSHRFDGNVDCLGVPEFLQTRRACVVIGQDLIRPLRTRRRLLMRMPREDDRMRTPHFGGHEGGQPDRSRTYDEHRLVTFEIDLL